MLRFHHSIKIKVMGRGGGGEFVIIKGIFITTVSSKGFEKSMIHRLKENLHINEFQSGVQNGHSVMDNLIAY